MSRTFTIFRRELAYFFNSPVAYAVITVFLFIAGYFFYNLLAYFSLVSVQNMQSPAAVGGASLSAGVLQPLFGNLSTILLLILPLLTMRLLSEERRTGTAELLFTFPITDWNAILGKYFATLAVYGVMLALTLVYPLLLRNYATPEWGVVVTGYMGLFLIGASYIAMGVFFSSLSDNQMVAGVSTFGCGLLFLLIGWIRPFVSTVAGDILGQLSILEHFGSFASGVVDSHDLLFYINFCLLFLFLSARVLESNRWRT